MISLYDEKGVEHKVSRKEYIEKILPANLRGVWNKADGLYQLIVISLQNEIYAEILDAAKRLCEIDPDKERSAVILGIVYLKLRKFDSAKELFEEYINRFGDSPVILVNYAKAVKEISGDQAALQLVRLALLKDPNFDNALEWYVGGASETGGDEAYIASLNEFAKYSNSWRPQLWLARNELEKGNLSGALELYNLVLARYNGHPDALMQISGDLGKHGHLSEIIRLIEPVYVPQQHGPYTGINLLQSYAEMKSKEKGLMLLDKMEKCGFHFIKQNLDSYRVKFESMKV